MNDRDPSFAAPLPEERLRQEVLERTLAPLVTAQETAHHAAGRAIAGAMDSYASRDRSQPYDREDAMLPAAKHAIDSKLLRTRIAHVSQIIASASPEDLADPEHEFDPHKAAYVAKTVAELVAKSNIASPKKRDRYAQRATRVAAAEYNSSPLRPGPDFQARMLLRHHTKSLPAMLVGTLIDKVDKVLNQ